jgi:hypothetical protein
METLTTEQIAGHYSAAGDSVTLINELVAIDTLTDDQKDTVSRNVEHLEIMVAKDYWTSENLEPFNSAIAAGNEKIA